MTDREILKSLLNKYGTEELNKMISDINNRKYKFETGKHSVEAPQRKNDKQNSHIIIERGFSWGDFAKMWNHISASERNKFGKLNSDELYNKIFNKRWYVLKSATDPNATYLISTEDEMK